MARPTESPPLRHPFWTSFGITLLLAAAVALSSGGSLLIGMLWLPGGASTVLAAVGGRRARLGVLAATLAVDAPWLPQVIDVPAPVIFVLLAIIAVGTWIKTGVAAHLMRPALAEPAQGRELRSIGRFLAAAALPGGISALSLALLLLSVGPFSLERTGSSLAIWWAGDAAAAMLSAPLVASMFAHPREIWAPRRLVSVLTAVFAWGSLVPVVSALDREHVHDIEAHWEDYADTVRHGLLESAERAGQSATAVALALGAHPQTLAAGGAPRAAPQATQDVAAVIDVLRRADPTATLLAYAPAVPASARAEFEAAADLRILTAQSGAQAVYFPLTLGSGTLVGDRWRGVDLADLPELAPYLRPALERAPESQVVAAPARLAGGEPGTIAVIRPVIADGPGGTAVRGVVFGLATLPLHPPVVHRATEVSGGQVVIEELAGDRALPIVAAKLPNAGEPIRHTWLFRETAVGADDRVSVLSKIWRIQVTGRIATDVFDPFGLWSGVLLVIGLLAAMLQSLVLLVTGREAAVRREVAQRTETLDLIGRVQGEYLNRQDPAEPGTAVDVAPLLEGMRRACGASSVRLERCGHCAGGRATCAGAPAAAGVVEIALSHASGRLGCVILEGVTLRGRLDEVQALGAAAAALLGSARTEAARHALQRRFDGFMGHLPVCVLMKDAQHRFVYANEAFEQNFAPPGLSVVGRSNQELWPPEIAARLDALDAEAFATDGLLVREEHIGGARGVRLWRTYTFMLDGADGERLQCGMALDIHDERQQAADIEASLREKEALLKEIHHRVKNNLQIVSSLLNLHRPDSRDPAVTAFIEESRHRIRSIALLHETLYRGGNFAAIDMDAYLRTLTAHLSRSFGLNTPGVRIEVSGGGLSLPLDQAIPAGLAINELISNALKHAFPEGRGGCISVGLAREPVPSPRVCLTVADDGVGIPEDYDPRAGRSLGVRLVYDLASQLGGGVELVRGAGTTFHIRFPLAAA